MKKDRNSFFSQYGYSGYSNNMMPQGMPNNYQNPYPYGNNNSNYEIDLDSKINRIERELNRLDERITRLESTIQTMEAKPSTTNTDYNFANSMYMV